MQSLQESFEIISAASTVNDLKSENENEECQFVFSLKNSHNMPAKQENNSVLSDYLVCLV